MTRQEEQSVAEVLEHCLAGRCAACPAEKDETISYAPCKAQRAGMVQIPYAVAEAALIALKARKETF